AWLLDPMFAYASKSRTLARWVGAWDSAESTFMVLISVQLAGRVVVPARRRRDVRYALRQIDVEEARVRAQARRFTTDEAIDHSTVPGQECGMQGRVGNVLRSG